LQVSIVCDGRCEMRYSPQEKTGTVEDKRTENIVGKVILLRRI
jgi:hypothetical protein